MGDLPGRSLEQRQHIGQAGDAHDIARRQLREHFVGEQRRTVGDEHAAVSARYRRGRECRVRQQTDGRFVRSVRGQLLFDSAPT